MAGGIDWFRWHHGTVTDAKFQLVARRAGASVAEVIAVWATVLEQASAAEDRGAPGLPDFEALDCALGMADGRAEGIYAAMVARRLVTDAGAVTAWHKRQPKREREDDGAAERQRAKRARDVQQPPPAPNGGGDPAPRHATCDHVTPCHATSRQDSPREEKRREEEEHTPRASAPPAGPPRLSCVSSASPGEDPNTEAAKAAEAMRAKGIDDADGADPRLLQMLAQGVQRTELVAAAEISRRKGKGMAYALGVVAERRKDAAQQVVHQLDDARPWQDSREGVERMGVELGLGPWDQDAAQLGRGEQYPTYRSRVLRAASEQQRA